MDFLLVEYHILCPNEVAVGKLSGPQKKISRADSVGDMNQPYIWVGGLPSNSQAVKE
jgi:hypothetical protein